MAREPAATSVTNLTPNSVKIVPTKERYHVQYKFNTKPSGAEGLALQYAVVVNGTVVHAHEKHPAVLADKRSIDLRVDEGSEVALFLNSDALPGRRQHPVYAVTMGCSDVLVNIVEKLGRGRTGQDSHVLGVISYSEKAAAPDGHPKDVYDAWLTGDTWMLISHVYTEAEATKLMPPNTHPAIVRAVLGIYQGLPAARLSVAFPATDRVKVFTVNVSFLEQENPTVNLVSFSLLSDGLPRVHPHAYVALLNAARANCVTNIEVDSGWRPLLGSIVHREGRGLDVTYIETGDWHVHIRRVGLLDKLWRGAENVSPEETRLYAEYEKAKIEAKKQLDNHRRAKDALHHNKSPDTLEKLTDEEQTAKRISDSAALYETRCGNDWNDERNKYEPGPMKTLRESLRHDPTVGQIMDPWYIDSNPHGTAPPKPNEQLDKNEIAHNNHLHITVKESPP